MTSTLIALTLENAALRLQLLPELGGGVSRFDCLVHGEARPVFRPRPAAALPDPDTLACYPLLPWSNRIGGGQFDFDGRRCEVGPTRADEALPIHGFGAFHAWECIEAEDDAAILSMRLQRDGWDFQAWQHFRLDAQQLRVTLTVCNHGRRMPFGLGLHPFFPRDGSTRLCAPARAVWPGGPDALPLARETPRDERDFGVSRPLPEGLTLNDSFTGWNGRAQIASHGLGLEIEAEADAYVLYTPQGRDFFCFEPVDHPVDAFHLAGGPAANGMTVLETGQTLSRRYRFAVSAS